MFDAFRGERPHAATSSCLLNYLLAYPIGDFMCPKIVFHALLLRMYSCKHAAFGCSLWFFGSEPVFILLIALSALHYHVMNLCILYNRLKSPCLHQGHHFRFNNSSRHNVLKKPKPKRHLGQIWDCQMVLSIYIVPQTRKWPFKRKERRKQA